MTGYKCSTTYSYEALGRQSSVSSGPTSSADLLTSQYGYTLQQWTSSLTTELDGRTVFSETLGYDSPSNSLGGPSYTGLITRKNETWTIPTGPSPSQVQPVSRTEDYAYDYAARLSGWDDASNGENISYDARGNITSRSPRYGSSGTITLTYTGDRLATRKVGTGTAVSFAHDSFARMTTDAESGLSITYNALDLPETVSMGNTLKAKYAYLSKGTKASALDASGAGLVYRGPFTYRRSSGGTLAFESVPFDSGRLTEAGARYHVTDHLGSVRAVIDGNASTTTYPLAGFYSVDDFAPFGVKSASSASSYLSLASTGSTVSLRDGFTGQEDQGPDFGIGYSDFGARQYSPSLSRWLVPDPMGEKYYDVSPYAYCAGNPVKIIDLDGNKIRVATDYQDQFISDITNVFGDKAEHFSFSKEGLLQLDCKKGIFTKGMSVEQKQVFRGLYKAMIDRKTTSIVYSDDYTVTNGDENESKSVVQEYGGGFYSKTDNLIVVAPSVGVISVTVDPLQDPLGGTFRVQDVQQNTTSALFHEIGERNTNSSYRGAVIDYENYVRTIIELPIRPYDIFHSSMIPQIEP